MTGRLMSNGESLLTIIREETLCDTSMTLNSAYKLTPSSYLVLCDGNEYKDIKSRKERKLSSSKCKKVHKVAKTVAIALCGETYRTEQRIFFRELRRYTRENTTSHLEQIVAAAKDMMERYFQFTVSCLIISGGSDQMWTVKKFKGRDETIDHAEFMPVVFDGEVSFEIRKKQYELSTKYTIDMPDCDTALHEAIAIYRQAHNENERIGGKIFAWVVDSDKVKPLGSVDDLTVLQE